MASDAGIVLEHNVAALVDSEAVILVVDRAEQSKRSVSDPLNFALITSWKRYRPVLDYQGRASRADIKAIRVVARRKAVAVRVGLVPQRCGPA